MSNLAAQIILHPKLSQSLAVLATTVGRDKVYRLLQYVARLVAWSLLRRGDLEAAARWEGLKNGFTRARKAMRLFRAAEFMQSAMNLSLRPITSLSPPGQIAHFAQIGRQLGYAGFFTADGMTWLGAVSFLKLEKEIIKKWQDRAYKMWLAGILCSMVSTSASLVKLRADGRRFALSNEVARREASKEEKTPEDRAREDEERRAKGKALLAQRQTLLSQMIMDSMDVWIPATGLGYTNLNDGVIGFLGVTSSYMGLQALWRKHAGAARKFSQ